MNYFFGFENTLSQNIDWFFNLNHLFLICFVALFVIICFFAFHAKSEKGIKATKIALACILFVLEVGRTIYKYLMHVHNGGTTDNFNWWWNISFQMCAIMCWTTIITLILSVCLKRENKFLQFLYNILFGCAMIGGILTFAYPDCLSENYPFLHFVNIQTVIVHALLIFVPIYLVKVKDLKVDIRNIWKVCVGYVYIGCVAMSASLISGNNFAYSLSFDLVDLGLPFPWHLPVIMLVMVAFAAVFYGAFEIVRFVKRKKGKLNVSEEEKMHLNKFDLAIYIVSNVCAILFGALIMLGTASLIGSPSTWLGVLCLLGLIYMILMLVFAEKFKKNINDEKVMQDKNLQITFVVLTFIFALPVGILCLIRYLKSQDTKTSSQSLQK